jgi:hypothetical protein
MSTLRKDFKTNIESEKRGIWFTAHIEEDGTKVRFKIASTSSANTKYLKAIEQASRPYRSMKKIPMELQLELAKKCYIENCLIDWENVPKEGGGELSFSLENAKELFKDIPHLLELLMRASDDTTNFQEGDWEQDAKNLQSA